MPSPTIQPSLTQACYFNGSNPVNSHPATTRTRLEASSELDSSLSGTPCCLLPTFIIGLFTTVFTMVSSGHYFLKQIWPNLKENLGNFFSKLSPKNLSKPNWLQFGSSKK